MGRGGGGGGGRSSGGGGSRSSGGRMSSSGRGRGASHRSSSSHGGYHSGVSYGYHRSSHYGGGGSYYHRSGCLTSIIVCLLLIVMLPFLARTLGDAASFITRSTVEREPLEASAVITADYYADELNWIGNPTKLTAGMKHFFQKTGVQPFLYITDTINGTKEPTSDDMDRYANQLYDELFEDEGHILILFHEYYSGQYSTWYVCGKQAKVVMDQEACDILLDYIDHYYYSDLKDEEMFSTAFDKAGERIMSVTKSPLPMIVVAICVVIAVFIAFSWWKKAKRQKNLEAEQTERILNADLDTLERQQEDSRLKDIENKY